MLRYGGIWMGIELGAERGVLVRCDGGWATWRGAWHQGITMALLRKQALDSAKADAEGLYNLLTGHAALHSGKDTLPQVNRVSFHGKSMPQDQY